MNCEKSMAEQSYSTHRLPPISYTGRFTLEPGTNCSNSLWAEPLFSLVSGLVGINPPSTSAPSSSSSQTGTSSSSSSSSISSIAISSQSSSLSCAVHHSENNPIYSAAPTYSSASPDIFSDQGQGFTSQAGGSLQYPPPSYNSKTCGSSFPVPMIPDYLFPSSRGRSACYLTRSPSKMGLASPP
ncbi:hypothetical protein UPYG_G00214100 [Umbra pygmaea]|uniref:Early growth response N-terminal domain-containing protein n=1 Tax=Umbra pygmaea TaxID=75934 RepID=A0ABD0WKE5_UMBPY